MSLSPLCVQAICPPDVAVKFVAACVCVVSPRRFCQQCARFHAIHEFDDTKRSCRTRLSQHNARRRRKPDAEEGGGDGDEGSGTSGTLPQLPADPPPRSSDHGGSRSICSGPLSSTAVKAAVAGAAGGYGGGPAPSSSETVTVSKRPQRAAALASMAFIQAEVAAAKSGAHGHAPAGPHSQEGVAAGGGPGAGGGLPSPPSPSPLTRSNSRARRSTAGHPSRSRMRLDSAASASLASCGPGGLLLGGEMGSGSGGQLPMAGAGGLFSGALSSGGVASGYAGLPSGWLNRAYMSQPGPGSAYCNARPSSGSQTGLSGSMARVKIEPGAADCGTGWSGSLPCMALGPASGQQLLQGTLLGHSSQQLPQFMHSEPLKEQGTPWAAQGIYIKQEGTAGPVGPGSVAVFGNAAASGLMPRLAPLAEMPDWAMGGLPNDLLVVGEGQGEGEGGDVEMDAAVALEAEMGKGMERGSGGGEGLIHAMFEGGAAGPQQHLLQQQGAGPMQQEWQGRQLPAFTAGTATITAGQQGVAAALQQPGSASCHQGTPAARLQQLGPGAGMQQPDNTRSPQMTALFGQPFALQQQQARQPPTILSLHPLNVPGPQAMGTHGLPQTYGCTNAFAPLTGLAGIRQQLSTPASAPLPMPFATQWPLSGSSIQLQPGSSTSAAGFSATGPGSSSATVPNLIHLTTLSSPQLNLPDIDMLTAELGGGWGAPSPASATTTPQQQMGHNYGHASLIVPSSASAPASSASRGVGPCSITPGMGRPGSNDPGSATGVACGSSPCITRTFSAGAANTLTGAGLGPGSAVSCAAGVGGDVGGAQEMLQRISLKVAGCMPDQLPPDLYARLASLVATSDAASLHALLNGS